MDVERTDAVAALTRDFGNEAAGFSFAEYEDEHGVPSEQWVVGSA
jgi:hypothetical protein